MFLSQVFCLEKMGLIPLLRRLGGAKDQDDREALWEAAETYHRLHQVLQLLLVQQPPPPPLLSQVELCSGSGGGAVYGLALALTSLNLARRGLARPRVKVNIRFCSKLLKIVSLLSSISGGDLRSAGHPSPSLLASPSQAAAAQSSHVRRQGGREVGGGRRACLAGWSPWAAVLPQRHVETRQIFTGGGRILGSHLSSACSAADQPDGGRVVIEVVVVEVVVVVVV